MGQKFKTVVRCNIHGKKPVPPYRGDDKIVGVGASRGRKDMGCPICRKERSQNQSLGTHNE